MVTAVLQSKKLTAREWYLLKMLARGVTPAEISRLLSISVKTVSQHTLNVEKKLGVKNRVFLMKFLINIRNQTDLLHIHRMHPSG